MSIPVLMLAMVIASAAFAAEAPPVRRRLSIRSPRRESRA